MYGLMLVAVLTIMGGMIAYIGDVLGSKVGKKKLTVFGLRPKHTSILVTIITGILIASTTLGVLSIASWDVRTALFGMEALKAELAGLGQDVQEKNSQLETMRTELAAKTQEYTAVSQKIEQTTAELAAVTQELQTVIKQRDQTAKALDKVQADYKQVQVKLTAAQQEITDLQKRKTDLESDVIRLNELTDNLRKGIQTVREGVVIYRAGQVLTTDVIKRRQSKADVQQDLERIMFDTNAQIVTALGIKDKDVNVLWISKTDFQLAVSRIMDAGHDMVVRISSAGNTIYGEPVIGRIDLYVNKLVYAENTLVYKETIGNVDSYTKAEKAVVLFLSKVNASATKAGILPDPLQGTVGSIGGIQLFETISKVQKINGKVELRAVTKDSVYTTGPLKITIQVTEVQ